MSSRETMPTVEPSERTGSFTEVNLGLTREQAVAEAMRCLTCASAPCTDVCPLGNDIPRFVTAIAEGRPEDAVFESSVPLTAVCGRVCYRPCEAACALGVNGEPLAINALERFAADARSVIAIEAKTTRPERVAIVGSGPAGIACAYELRRAGCRVAVFEAAGVCGGMLALGIPAYRLPRDVLARELGALRRMGIHFVPSQPVGSAFSLEALREHFQAVFIGVGAHRGRRLGIPGDEAPGVSDAVAFLRRVNLGDLTPPGQRVVVVGGGDSAMDAARTAVRLGCARVIVLYRRSRAEMPCNPGEFDEAEAEGIEGMFLAAPVRVCTGPDGRVNALECIRMRLGAPDKSGRPRPEPLPGSEFLLETDCVIPAISQDPDLDLLAGNGALHTSRWGTLTVDDDTLQTSMPGVFAGGDAVSGPRTVGEAMQMGRRAAAAILAHLDTGS
jgi:NADPH-dependent glutamate synthase beta subunit-like oxidoreductase